MESTKVSLYARVSTSDKGQDPEMQLRELREFAARRGFDVVEEFVDRTSGAKESRPALDRLMNDARRRRFDAVIVWKLDRLGRSLKHLVNVLADLGTYGVAFISMNDNLDLSTPTGRLLFGLLASMAEFERSLIQERVKAGLRFAKSRGKRLGRPKRTVDVERVRELRVKGRSWPEIAGELGVSRITCIRAARGVSKTPPRPSA